MAFFAIRTNDRVVFKLPVFEGNWRSPRCVGDRVYVGVIERHSYGQKSGQHTFSVRLADGSLKLVKGRNLYPNIIEYIPDPDSPDRQP